LFPAFLKRISGVILAGLLLTCAGRAQTPKQPSRLAPGTAVERKFVPPETHSYQISLDAGEYLHITVKETRTDLSAKVTGPDGKAVTQVQDSQGDWREFPISLVASLKGTYRLELSASDKNAPAGAYRMEVGKLRQAAPEDEKRVAAERDFISAERLNTDGSKESLQIALKKYQALLPVWQALGDRRSEAKTLYSAGLIYWTNGDPHKTIELLNQSLPLWRESGDKTGEGASISGIGSTYFSKLEDPQKALEYNQKALSILHEASARDHESTARIHEARTLDNIGQVYFRLGETQKSLDYMGQAGHLHHEDGDRIGEALVLHNMGAICEHLGELQKALDYLLSSLALHRQVSAKQGEIHVLNAIGVVYRDLGQWQRSADYLNQALALRPADPRLEAEMVDHLGNAYRQMDQPQKALEYHQRALSLLNRLDDRVIRALTFESFGDDYLWRGEGQRALGYFEQELTLRRAISDRSGEGLALVGMGEASALLGNSGGNLGKALEYLNQAAQILAATRERTSQAYALSKAAGVERRRGNLLNALTMANQSIELDESVRRDVSGENLRASFLGTVRYQYELKIGLLAALHRDAEALQASEMARARSLVESLRESHVDFRQGVDRPLIEKEHGLQMRLRGKAMRQVQLLAGKHTDDQAAAAEKEILDLTSEYEQVEAAIRAKSPAYAALTQPKPMTAAGIQKQLDPNTLLLEYLLTDEGSFLWAVTQTSLSTYKLPKKTEVEAAARRAYRALSDAAGTDNAAWADLSRMVLGPVASQLGSARLVVVPDGALHFVPFAALPSPTSGKPLVVEHEVVSLPSAFTLAEQRRELVGRRTAPRTVAVLADPVFDGADPRVSGAKQTIKPSDELTRSAAETGFGGFPRLAASRREANGIAALAPAGRSLEALDFDASRATATGNALSQYRIVHFATHGLLNAQHPELSGIVLSLVNRKGEPDNGFLQAHEMYNLKLGADLVVMSACQTALGKEIRGEGLVGLTRGLMYAGATRVVASLWRVPDVATAELMKRFYKAMLADGLRPAAALRQAQVSIWQEGRWARPYYWAAFTMQGDWR
jgi:CHAT domain-containing protein/tetratricopeptide (TPR) repeat protein